MIQIYGVRFRPHRNRVSDSCNAVFVLFWRVTVRQTVSFGADKDSGLSSRSAMLLAGLSGLCRIEPVGSVNLFRIGIACRIVAGLCGIPCDVVRFSERSACASGEAAMIGRRWVSTIFYNFVFEDGVAASLPDCLLSSCQPCTYGSQPVWRASGMCQIYICEKMKATVFVVVLAAMPLRLSAQHFTIKGHFTDVANDTLSIGYVQRDPEKRIVDVDVVVDAGGCFMYSCEIGRRARPN